jgi:hypothetical protein
MSGIACIDESRGAYRVLVVKPEGKRPLGRHRHRWEDNIKMGFQEVGWRKWTGSFVVMTGPGGGVVRVWI